MITLSITILNSNKTYDINVNEAQKIKDTLYILEENLNLNLGDLSKIYYVQSKRTKRNINVEMNYEQAGIFNGEELEILPVNCSV
jgi:hypothetical protein